MKYPTTLLLFLATVIGLSVGCGESQPTENKEPIVHKANAIEEESIYKKPPYKPPYLIAITENKTLIHWVDSLNTKSQLREELDTIIYSYYNSEYYTPKDTIKLLITDINKNKKPEFTPCYQSTSYEWVSNDLNPILTTDNSIDTIITLVNQTFLRTIYANVGGDYNTYYTIVDGLKYEQTVYLNPYMKGEWDYKLMQQKITDRQIIVDYEFSYFIPSHYYCKIMNLTEPWEAEPEVLLKAKLKAIHTWSGNQFNTIITSNKPFAFNIDNRTDFPHIINEKELYNPDNYPLSNIKTFLNRNKYIEDNNLSEKETYKYLYLLKKDHKVLYQPKSLKGNIKVQYDKIFDAVGLWYDTRTVYNIIDSITVTDKNNDNKAEFCVSMTVWEIYLKQQGDSLVITEKVFKDK